MDSNPVFILLLSVFSPKRAMGGGSLGIVEDAIDDISEVVQAPEILWFPSAFLVSLINLRG